MRAWQSLLESAADRWAYRASDMLTWSITTTADFALSGTACLIPCDELITTFNARRGYGARARIGRLAALAT